MPDLSRKPTILFIGHDANRAGAQLFLLSIMRYFRKEGFGTRLLLIHPWGALREEFAAEFEVYVYHDNQDIAGGRMPVWLKGKKKNNALDLLARHKIDLVYANTIASAGILEEVHRKIGKPVISHIHELAYSLGLYASQEDLNKLRSFSSHVIACSQAVGDHLSSGINIPARKISVVHSFVNNEEVKEASGRFSPDQIRKEFGIPASGPVVMACGNADWRKGLDIFLQTANKVLKSGKKVHFVWVGIRHEGEIYHQALFDMERLGIGVHITLIEPTDKAVSLLNASDVFILTSREDPFPLVMLEAALCHKPIAGFEKSGGAGEFIGEDAGLLAPYLDTEVLSAHILRLLDSPEDRKRMGDKAFEKVRDIYNFETSVHKIRHIIESLL